LVTPNGKKKDEKIENNSAERIEPDESHLFCVSSILCNVCEGMNVQPRHCERDKLCKQGPSQFVRSILKRERKRGKNIEVLTMLPSQTHIRQRCIFACLGREPSCHQHHRSRCRHTGHESALRNHSSMQFLWKRCIHSNVRSSSPIWNSSKQTLQLVSSPEPSKTAVAV